MGEDARGGESNAGGARASSGVGVGVMAHGGCVEGGGRESHA